MCEGCESIKTVRDYIYDLGRPERVHDYDSEVKRIIEMIDKKDRDIQIFHHKQISRLEAKIEDLETINSCLAKCVREMREKYE